MVENVSTKKPAARKAVRHSKKYWRKGTDVEIYEDSIHDIAAQKRAGGVVADMADADIFTIDRTPNANQPTKKFTKRQQAALDKISKSLSDLETVTLPEPKAPPKVKKQKVVIPSAVKVEKSKNQKNYDLWDTDFTPTVKLDNKAAGEHFLRYTKKKLPSRPTTMKQKTSLLNAVSIPDAGASYNPTADDYQNYVSEIAQDELKVIREEEKIQKGNKPQKESIVTVRERELELTEGLPIHPDYDSDEEEKEATVQEDEEKMETDEMDEQDNKKKPKTRKQRETAKRIKKEERERLQQKEKEKHQHEVFRAKKLLKQIEAEEDEKKKAALERARQKLIKKYTERQRLGKGKFEDEEAPFLLQEELPESLRQLKPQGNILTDRLKSMQKRNMLPIGGKRGKKLREKFRVKYVEKRSAKEIKKGTILR